MKRNQEKSTARMPGDIGEPGAGGLEMSGMGGTERAYWVNRLFQRLNRSILVLTATAEAADSFLSDLQFFAGAEPLEAVIYPPYNILPYNMLSYHSETAARKIETLFRLVDNGRPLVIIAPVSAAMQRVLPRSELADAAELVMAGEELDRDRLIEQLISGGYQPAAIVEEPGDFCVRGGVLDVYSPGYADPIRIEQFGDTVDTIRFFSPASQRSRAEIEDAVILPAKEAMIRETALDRLITRIRSRAAQQDLAPARIRQMVEQLRNDRTVPGVESLLPVIYPELETLFDYLPNDAVGVQIEPAALEQASEEIHTRIEESYAAARKEERFCLPPEALYLNWADLSRRMPPEETIRLRTLPVGDGSETPSGTRSVRVSVTDTSDLQQALRDRGAGDRLLQPLADWIGRQTQSGCTVFIVCRSRSRADRLAALLEPYDLHPKIMDGLPVRTVTSGGLFLCIGRLSAGFIWPEEAVAFATDEDVFGSRARRRRHRRQKAASRLLAFEDLKAGDLVVHEEHGIGRYDGLVKLRMNGVENDFLLIAYKAEDRLYLPVDRMEMIRKYMGVDGVAPALDKMGGRSWERTKERVKRSAEKIAGELLTIYAARKVRKGFACTEVDGLMRDFEADFPYEETADQKRAIEAVFDDMMDPTPMDRLICGDVGYGKTEVALRAAFLSVFNGKQVAVLVPTTVLAEQHYETFRSRFSRYPVAVACLSRFRSPREQRRLVEGLKAGTVDIVIGTHRLLQRDVHFKELGLLVLDEEQRFGVKHKEKLKRYRATVDVLTLTATPIPRTLHLSLVGVRDISIINTPPEDRQSIITYLSEFNDAVVRDAIRKELRRKGQIFFVHNTIASIDRMAMKLQALVPEVRLDVAHGRLDEDALEQTMLRFVNREIDLLLCTTIVESGLDIPSANTILVNRADRFGLSQMYQLRGRVGRSDEQAYAYLFIPPENTLGRDALKRLKVLMEHSDLGSGFQIAMNDLKIRGGGTILGVSQSGHIAAVGYDMFLKLMEESIARLKGEPVTEPLDPEVHLPIAAFIPETYIGDIDQRLTAYRRLSRMEAPGELRDFKEELADRFGRPPEEAENLLMKILLKLAARKCGVKRLELMGARLQLHLSQDHLQHPAGVVDLIRTAPDRFRLTPDNILKVRLARRSAGGPIAQVKNILKQLDQHVNY